MWLASRDPSRGMQSKNPGGQDPEAEPRMRQKKIIGRSNLQNCSSSNLQSLKAFQQQPPTSKNNQAAPKATSIYGFLIELWIVGQGKCLNISQVRKKENSCPISF